LHGLVIQYITLNGIEGIEEEVGINLRAEELNFQFLLFVNQGAILQFLL
jgi:hypothetical protein